MELENDYYGEYFKAKYLYCLTRNDRNECMEKVAHAQYETYPCQTMALIGDLK